MYCGKCKMLTIGKTGWGVYGSSLYYFGNFSINLTLFPNKMLLKKRSSTTSKNHRICLILSHCGPHSLDGAMGWRVPGLECWWRALSHELFEMPILTVKAIAIPERHVSDSFSEHLDVFVSIPKKINKVLKKKKGNYLWHVYNLEQHKIGNKWHI